MSGIKVWHLYCDGPSDTCPLDGGEASEGDQEPGLDTLAEYRRRMKAYGWKSRGGKDYCPDCSAVSASAGAGNG